MQTGQEGQVSQDTGGMEFGGTAGTGDRGKGHGTSHEQLMVTRKLGSHQASWGEGGTDTTLAPRQAGVAQRWHTGVPWCEMELKEP